MVPNIITANLEMFPHKQLKSSKNSLNKNAFENTATDSVEFEILFEKYDFILIWTTLDCNTWSLIEPH